MAEFINYDGMYAQREKPKMPKIATSKEIEEDRLWEIEQKAKQKKMDDEHDAFIARLMADDEPEIKKPKGFEDFEPSTGK